MKDVGKLVRGMRTPECTGLIRKTFLYITHGISLTVSNIHNSLHNHNILIFSCIQSYICDVTHKQTLNNHSFCHGKRIQLLTDLTSTQVLTEVFCVPALYLSVGDYWCTSFLPQTKGLYNGRSLSWHLMGL